MKVIYYAFEVIKGAIRVVGVLFNLLEFLGLLQALAGIVKAFLLFITDGLKLVLQGGQFLADNFETLSSYLIHRSALNLRLMMAFTQRRVTLLFHANVSPS